MPFIVGCTTLSWFFGSLPPLGAVILAASPEDAAAQGVGGVGCVDAPVHSGADTEPLGAECVVAHPGVVAIKAAGDLTRRLAGHMSAPSGQQGGEVALLEIVAAGGHRRSIAAANRYVAVKYRVGRGALGV